jgi:deoxycytidine triphosphate deaminase
MPFSNDPYPGIPPALLNSVDLRAYAEHASVQLISEFDPKKLKSASYEIPFEGTIHYWESDGILGRLSKKEFDLKDDRQFDIRPNSIVYVCPKVRFRIPNYLALRFNLTITRVHQGLLLGTGPLVDPGFEGRLLIPLHNLTNQQISIAADQGFIWVEVTKLSPFSAKDSSDTRSHVLFPDNKKNLTALQYFRKANQGKPITSSVQATLDEAKVVQSQTKALMQWGFGGAAIGIAALLLAAFQLYSLVQSANGRYDAITADGQDQKKRLEAHVLQLHEYATRLEAQSTQLSQEKDEIMELRKTIDELRQTKLVSKPR